MPALPPPTDDEAPGEPDLGSTEIDDEPQSATESMESGETKAQASARRRPSPDEARGPRGEAPQAPRGPLLAGKRRPERLSARPVPAPAPRPVVSPSPQAIRPLAAPSPGPAQGSPQDMGVSKLAAFGRSGSSTPPRGAPREPRRPIIPAGTSLLLESDPPVPPGSVPPTVQIPPPSPHGETTGELAAGVAMPPSDKKVIAGRYEVEQALGEGGMGAVFRVFDRELKRSAALKMILAHKRDAKREARFLHEARAMAKLQHPACVQIYDAGLDRDGSPFLVMELVTGEQLLDICARGELSPRRAALIVHQIAGALQFAHEAGIIHRDVKPHNILVSPDGGAKLADFGIARDEEARTKLTQEGAMIGTLSYMPPEQTGREDDQVDARSDVYALGATLYETLAGRPPFVGSYRAVLSAVLDEDPEPLRKISPEVPRDLEVICLKCLAKEKAARYQTARALQEDLGRFLADEPVSARVPGFLERAWRVVKRHRKLVLASLSAAAAVGTVVGGMQAGVTVRLRTEAAAAIADGNESFASGKFEKAEESFVAAAKLDTPRAKEAQDLAFKARAWKLAAEADKVFAVYLGEMAEIERMAPTIEELTDNRTAPPTPTAFAEDEKKQHLAALMERSASLGTSSDRHLHEAELAMQNALAVFPDRALAERLIAMNARVYDLTTDVDPLTLEPLAARAEALAKRYECDARLPRGTIAVNSSPAGGLVRLYRYEFDRKFGVDRPHAFSRDGKDLGAAPPTRDDYFPLLAQGNDLGVTPLAPVALPAGNYLVTIEKEGFLLARLPLVVRRKSQQKLEAHLYPTDVLGALTPEFAYVPAGPARSGRGLRTVENVGDFFIMNHEVTLDEWDRFYKDMGESPQDFGAFYRSLGFGSDVLERYPSAAICAVGTPSVRAFVRWFAEKHRTNLREWQMDLPHAREYFRAVRGPLVRDFPWGNLYDASFTDCASGDGLVLKPVKSFPQDCSVFNVYDLAGGVSEFIAEQDPEERFAYAVGGAKSDSHLTCRYALSKVTRFGNAHLGNVFTGLRLAVRAR